MGSRFITRYYIHNKVKCQVKCDSLPSIDKTFSYCTNWSVLDSSSHNTFFHFSALPCLILWPPSESHWHVRLASWKAQFSPSLEQHLRECCVHRFQWHHSQHLAPWRAHCLGNWALKIAHRWPQFTVVLFVHSVRRALKLGGLRFNYEMKNDRKVWRVCPHAK